MNAWRNLGVEGHFKGKSPWFEYHKLFKKSIGLLLGAKEEETVVMNNLTVNLHLMMVSFYRSTASRYKIIIEGGAFPSDQYVVETQVIHHGFSPSDSVIELIPRAGEETLRTEDIISIIHEHGDTVALVLLSGVQYYTGQCFEMETIMAAGHDAGTMVGFDLAHAIGNIPMELHKWNVDFAAWCSYKYLNSGPGGTSGVFVHERHGNDLSINRFAGWWGQDEKERFLMKKGFRPMSGADGWQVSNKNILSMAAQKAALEPFTKIGMAAIRAKSLALTGYLEFLIEKLNKEEQKVTVITPSNTEHRGCQLSLSILNNGKSVFDFINLNPILKYG